MTETSKTTANRTGGEAWSFGPVTIPWRRVQRRGMEARLTPRRLLSLAAIAAIVASASACGGGSGTQGAMDPPLQNYTSHGLSFTYPAAWTAYPSKWPGELHFNPLVYLSTQPLQNPCLTHGNETTCGFPVHHLQPGGVLIVWQTNGIPVTGLGPGTRIKVGGHPASLTDTAGGECRKIGADRTIDVAVETSPPPSAFTYLTACLREPGVTANENSVQALLASTQFVS